MVSLHVPQLVLSIRVAAQQEPPRWQFDFRTLSGEVCFEANDVEPDIRSERLELLTLVRALEALDQPSLIAMEAPSFAIRRGIRFGIPEWRNSNWQWERFGEMVPIKDADLWQRFDRAMRFHSIKFQPVRVDNAHSTLRGPTRRRRVAEPVSADVLGTLATDAEQEVYHAARSL